VRGPCGDRGVVWRTAGTLSRVMSPTWIWMQIAIIVFVVAGMIIAITKLA
jgi:hypothetical protein